MRGKTRCVLLLICYTAHNAICAYIVCVLLTSILQNFSSDLHISVKFKLSCTVHENSFQDDMVSNVVPKCYMMCIVKSLTYSGN